MCTIQSVVVQETMSNTAASSRRHAPRQVSVAGEPRVLGQVWLPLADALIQADGGLE